jgi:hypothetical protein
VTTPRKRQDPDDRERTVAAAMEALVGAAMTIGGVLLGGLVGLTIAMLGILGLGHAVLLGLGLVGLPEEQGRARKRG